MLVRLLTVAAIFMCACSAGVGHIDAGEVRSGSLRAALSGAGFVEVFFYEVTDNKDRKISKIKDLATRRIYRACGSGCLSLMSGLVDQVDGAQEAECSDEGFDLVLSVGGRYDVAYTNSSREIYIDGECYISEKSAYDIIKNSRIIFPY